MFVSVAAAFFGGKSGTQNPVIAFAGISRMPVGREKINNQTKYIIVGIAGA